MTQDTVSPEARTVNTLVLDTETGTLNPDAGFAGVPLMGIMKNLVNGDKRAKVAPLIPEADNADVRAFCGENSVNGWDITITNNLNGASVEPTGIHEIGASTTQPQHKGVSATQLLHHLGAMAGCPQNAKFVNTLIDALALEQSGASKDEVAQHYADNKINWSPSTEAKNTLLAKVRKTTMATTAAKVSITRD